MPTRAGWLVAAGAVASWVAGRAFAAIELFVLGAIGLVLLATAVVWVRRREPEVVVARKVVPDQAIAGRTARVDLVVRNGGRRTPAIALVDPVSSTVGARLSVGPLAPDAAEVVGYRLPTGRRGVLHLGPLRLELVDPFGLARRPLAEGDRLDVTVLPAIEEVEPAPVGPGGRAEGAGGGRRIATQTPNDDLVSLRPYVVGDDLRRVHWPASARADDLLVRRDEERWQGHLTLVLDVDPAAMGAAAFEQAVSAAASIVHHVAESGDRVRLVASDGYDSGMVDARRAEGALLEHLAHLAQAPTELALPTAPSDRRSSLVVLSGAQRAARAGALLRGDEQATGWVVRFGGPSTTAGPDGPGGLAVGAGDRFAERWRHLAGRRAEART
ncbi:MAG: DUF58 domain-containing protein [Acidimicrobiales bacterium]|nr:DUF58 domain-containing protein [Acidimicrobiales bacterium]